MLLSRWVVCRWIHCCVGSIAECLRRQFLGTLRADQAFDRGEEPGLGEERDVAGALSRFEVAADKGSAASGASEVASSASEAAVVKSDVLRSLESGRLPALVSGEVECWAYQRDALQSRK